MHIVQSLISRLQEIQMCRFRNYNGAMPRQICEKCLCSDNNSTVLIEFIFVDTALSYDKYLKFQLKIFPLPPMLLKSIYPQYDQE